MEEAQKQQYRKAYYLKHKAKINARRKEYYLNNKERENALARAWRLAHPNVVADNRANYRARDKTKFKDWHLRKKYGLTLTDVETMSAAQHHCCLICTLTFSATPQVDHDHTTNTVRGLLCAKCNKALGLLGDSVQTLHRAISYLEKACHELSLPEAKVVSEDGSSTNWKAAGIACGESTSCTVAENSISAPMLAMSVN